MEWASCRTFRLPAACSPANTSATSRCPRGARLTHTQRLADRFLTEANWWIVERLTDFCAKRSHSMLELAFSWLAARPAVASVIAGATKPEQVEQNVKAADWVLTPEDMVEIDRITHKT